MGGFNAKVGSSERQGATWYGVRGYERIGKLNESGEVLLSFCVLNELVNMNTYFEKNIYKYTWQHPGNKPLHCIDYVIMRTGRGMWHRGEQWHRNKASQKQKAREVERGLLKGSSGGGVWQSLRGIQQAEKALHQ